MHKVVVSLSKHIDKYAKGKNPAYEDNLISESMRNTEKAKGRLLYYFPLSDEQLASGSSDSWIGWHNDSGFLTALAGDMYMDDVTLCMDLLKEEKLAIVPGSSFGAKGTIRISYATSMEELVVAMDKLTRFLEGKRVGK